MKYSQKVILITGCSSGFGLLMAARLASLGHKVYATMRNLDKKDALVNELNKRGAQANILQLDVTNKESIKKTIDIVSNEYGYIDVLINNAGFGMGGFFEDLDDKEIRLQLETNFFGVQNVIREVVPLMRPRKEGKIINVSSIAGLTASPCFSAYNASKWALEGFSESLMYELKLFGIGVHLIEPGTYKTKIFHENANYATNFDNKESPYYAYSQYLREKVMEYVNDCYKNPEDVAVLAEKIIMSKNPPFRNIPDLESKVLFTLRKCLPFRLYSFLINKILPTKLSDGRNP
ncbi:MAG: SDR family oxidoreductase [Candidatus Zapsychrus exili]|nr:SDR family oxidoreductase [Candidatus Zapsychrus exili]